MIPLKPRERIVLSFIFEYHAQWKNAPLVREISERCGGSPSGVCHTLHSLSTKGFIDWIYVGPRKLIVPLWKE